MITTYCGMAVSPEEAFRLRAAEDARSVGIELPERLVAFERYMSEQVARFYEWKHTHAPR